jgi:DNA invertase Pin-like site-specific DNA recombinase
MTSIDSAPVRAAQYLRMSTDSQRYSLDNQAAVIGSYAAMEGFQVVASYEDAGKSGLTASKRDGLQALLRDVLSGEAEFSTILVLDVSRWGRFQDPDEAAHYEFLCREAGVEVRYCAEAFENGPTGSIMKQLKRVMAGEYSRELSAKTRVGQLRQGERGFVIGGIAPYGFRRQVVHADGSLGGLLADGERCPRATDAVRWTLGPAEEIAQIRRIFDLCVTRRLSNQEIADTLNDLGLRWRDGTPWERHRVKYVLRCEMVIGNYVYHSRTQHLRGPVRWLPESQWRRVRMVQPIISRARFEAAARMRDGRAGRRYNDARLLGDLRRLLRRYGRLSAAILDKTPGVANAGTYAGRFGSLREAYRLAGFECSNKGLRKKTGERITDQQVLDRLKAVYLRRGMITGRIIDTDRTLPSTTYFLWNYGSLAKAYAAAGIETIGRRGLARKLKPVARSRALKADRRTVEQAAWT